MLRKLTIISLCIILLFQAGGLLFFYLIKMKAQEVVQQELLHQNKNCEIRIFSQHDFNLLRVNVHEIVIDGKMYDFSTIEQTKDYITVKMISDNHEYEIFHAIGMFFGRDLHENPSKDFPKHIIQWLHAPYMSSATWEWKIPTFVKLSSSLYNLDFFPTTIKDIIPRPPKA